MERISEPQIRCLVVYVNPLLAVSPVAPIGPEKLCSLLFKRFGLRIACSISAPFLVKNWRTALRFDLRKFCPTIVLVSFRNLDSGVTVAKGAMVTRSFVAHLREALAIIRERYHGPLLIGGSGFSSAPFEILESCHLEYGVVGPGEAAVTAIFSRVLDGQDPETVLKTLSGNFGIVCRGMSRVRKTGECAGDTVFLNRHPGFLNLAQAIGDRVAVVCSMGCSGRCLYCVEPSFTGRRVFRRRPEAVVTEIEALVAAGFKRIWLSASELNLPNPEFAKQIFWLLRKRKICADFRGFMAAGSVDAALLGLMEDCGIKPFEWSFEFGHLSSRVLQGGGGPQSRSQQDALINLFLARGYPVVGGTVVFGTPLETEATLAEAFARANEIDQSFPEGFGLHVSFATRVYPVSILGRMVRSHPEQHKPYLYPPRRRGLLLPVIYSKPYPPHEMERVIRTGLGRLKGGLGVLNL